MAQRLGVDHQGLQQFVTTSTWDTAAVRMRLAVWGVELGWAGGGGDRRHRFPKDGKGSPCVAQ